MINLKSNETIIGFSPNFTHRAVIGKKLARKEGRRKIVRYVVEFVDFPTWLLVQNGQTVEQVALMQIRNDAEIEDGFDLAHNFRGYLGTEEIEEDEAMAREDEKNWTRLAREALSDTPAINDDAEGEEDEDEDDDDDDDDDDLSDIEGAEEGEAEAELVETEPKTKRRSGRGGSMR